MTIRLAAGRLQSTKPTLKFGNFLFDRVYVACGLLAPKKLNRRHGEIRQDEEDYEGRGKALSPRGWSGVSFARPGDDAGTLCPPRAPAEMTTWFNFSDKASLSEKAAKIGMTFA